VKSRNFRTWDEIENKSAFLQLCIDNAVDIMAWDILKKADPEQYDIPQEKPYEEIVEEFNAKHPLDPLTAKRLGKNTNGPKPEPTIKRHRKESNPAL
jgi:hypothetical protein